MGVVAEVEARPRDRFDASAMRLRRWEEDVG